VRTSRTSGLPRKMPAKDSASRGPNVKAQQRRELSELHVWESRDASAVFSNACFGVLLTRK